MSLSAAEIENIVRAVVQRLRSDSTTPAVSPSLPLNNSADHAAVAAKTLQLEEPLVTLRTLEGRLLGVQRVQVASTAIITPAVRDELRDQRIELTFVAPSESSTASTGSPADGNGSQPAKSPQRLLLITDFASGLQERSCGEVVLGGGNIQSDVCRIAAHLNSGGNGCLWWSQSPFAAVRGALGNKSLRAVQLFRNTDFGRAVQEADPNVFVLDGQAWTQPQIRSLAEQWKARLK